MNEKGFTLVELLAVIAIIGLLAVFVVPNVLKINTNINERLLSQKIEDIEYAAELYASNNPDIFNGTDVVYVTVQQLLNANYLENDSKYTGEEESNCSKSALGESLKDYETEIQKTGCVISNTDGTILNNVEVKLSKKTVGVVAEYQGNKESTTTSESNTLVGKVCEGFNTDTSNNSYDGVTLDGKSCWCVKDSTQSSGYNIVDSSGNVSECIIVSNESGNVNNWLKYGSSKANWRVLGLYRIDTDDDGSNDTVVAKMITSDVID